MVCQDCCVHKFISISLEKEKCERCGKERELLTEEERNFLHDLLTYITNQTCGCYRYNEDKSSITIETNKELLEIIRRYNVR